MKKDLGQVADDHLDQEKIPAKGSKPKTLRSARKLAPEKVSNPAQAAESLSETKKNIEVQKVNKEQPKSEQNLSAKSPEQTKVKEQKSVLKLQISSSLARKLKYKAHGEGVTPEELASELISEGLVLRAWEIMERKTAMKSSSSTSQGNHQNNRHSKGYRNQNFKRHQSQGHWNQNQSGNGGNGGNWHDGNNHASNHSARDPLDDQAAFFEYVRNQEKNQR